MNYFWDDWLVPILTTVSFHAVIVYLVLSSMELAPLEIIPTKIPDYIRASLVSKPLRKEPVSLPSANVPKTKAPVVENLTTAEVLAGIGDYTAAETLELKQAVDSDTLLDKAADLSSLLDAIENEDSVLQEESDLNTIAKYKMAIQAGIQSKWSRPPSARNGMQAVLHIRLVPSGEVISVTVLTGSGNDAFDRSAANAVWLNERFSSLAEMEPRLFEEYFRELNLVFKPEDLLL